MIFRTAREELPGRRSFFWIEAKNIYFKPIYLYDSVKLCIIYVSCTKNRKDPFTFTVSVIDYQYLILDCQKAKGSFRTQFIIELYDTCT